MNTKISVIGCGWLGLTLAKTLIELKYGVHGSTTSKQKFALLEDAQIVPFLLQFSSEGVIGNITSCLKDCQTVIINIPPGLRKNPDNNYVKQMKHVVDHIEESEVENVLLIGSTSVYEDEEHIPNITEHSPTSNSKTALQLLEVEALFSSNQHFKTTVIRFSGLFNQDRHPATFLSGKTNLKNGNAPVNLIHRQDCVSIIVSVVKNNIWGSVINASAPSHPTKANYYTAICKTFQIPAPQFDNTTISKGKIIDSTKLVQLLNYEFQIKSLL